jgi:tetratricopeptide (TPR) repeat protein
MPDAGPQPDRQKLIIGGLLALVAAVILLLPNLVTEPWIVDPDNAAAPAIPITSVSPSTAAEKTQYRQNSQKLLAEIIMLRDGLTSQSIEQWADFEFRSALSLISMGDEQYGYGNYSDSMASFNQALEQLKALQILGEEKYQQALITGASAIENAAIGDPAIASAAASLAMAIDPSDSRSIALNQRATALPQLIEALQNAEQQLTIKQLEKASSYYQQAVAIDGKHKKAADGLAATQRAITEQRFRRAMSRGFAALEQNLFPQATDAFNQAGKIYPGRQAVVQALSQVETQQSQLLVSQQMQRAADLEQQEQWQQALSIYQSLLQTDPSLTQAKVKTIPVAVRATVHSQLQAALADPLKLSNTNAYQKGQRLLKDARGIANPGPVLSQQIANLDKYLRQSTIPVPVVLRSDSLTEVTLFRVAKLGTFEQTSVQLKPGRYIAAGSRNGYRDVRVEFTITGEPMEEPILVSCNEAI